MMINKKHILSIMIILIISVLSVGCKSAEEKVLEKASSEDVKTDENSSVPIKNPDTSIKAGENLEWPADKMDPLPTPDAKITSIIESVEENVTIVQVEFNEPGLARDYIQKVKDLGYIENSMEDREGTFEFIGYKEDNTEVTINYLEMREVGYISLKRDSNSVKEFFENK